MYFDKLANESFIICIHIVQPRFHYFLSNLFNSHMWKMAISFAQFTYNCRVPSNNLPSLPHSCFLNVMQCSPKDSSFGEALRDIQKNSFEGDYNLLCPHSFWIMCLLGDCRSMYWLTSRSIVDLYIGCYVSR